VSHAKCSAVIVIRTRVLSPTSRHSQALNRSKPTYLYEWRRLLQVGTGIRMVQGRCPTNRRTNVSAMVARPDVSASRSLLVASAFYQTVLQPTRPARVESFLSQPV
jgi:hypothetical protein